MERRARVIDGMTCHVLMRTSRLLGVDLHRLLNIDLRTRRTLYGYKSSMTPDASPTLTDPSTRSQSSRINVEPDIINCLLDDLVLGYASLRCRSESRVSTESGGRDSIETLRLQSVA